MFLSITLCNGWEGRAIMKMMDSPMKLRFEWLKCLAIHGLITVRFDIRICSCCLPFADEPSQINVIHLHAKSTNIDSILSKCYAYVVYRIMRTCASAFNLSGKCGRFNCFSWCGIARNEHQFLVWTRTVWWIRKWFECLLSAFWGFDQRRWSHSVWANGVWRRFLVFFLAFVNIRQGLPHSNYVSFQVAMNNWSNQITLITNEAFSPFSNR